MSILNDAPSILGPIDTVIAALSGVEQTVADFAADESEWMLLPKSLFSAEALSNFERCWPQ